jgi:hypothetical protein
LHGARGAGRIDSVFRTVLAAVLAVGLAASVANAGRPGLIEPGLYFGETATGSGAGFEIREKNRQLFVHGWLSFAEGRNMECSDDRRHSFTHDFVTPKRKLYRLATTNRFEIKAKRNGGAYKVEVEGRLSKTGEIASGTLFHKVRINRRNKLDPDGNVRCFEDVRWRAEKD